MIELLQNKIFAILNPLIFLLAKSLDIWITKDVPSFVDIKQISSVCCSEDAQQD